MEEISTIKKNIFYFIDYKGITKEEFYNKTGISSSNFKGVNRKSEIGGDKLIKILTIYPEINAEWLLTGNGEMIKQTGNINISGNNSGINNTGVNQGTISINNSASENNETPNDIQLLIQSLQKTIHTLEKSLLSAEKINALQEKEISRLEKELLKNQM